MMDSKLFFGTELGCMTEIIPRLKVFYPHNSTGWEYLTWVNTKIPMGLYLDVWYPHFHCPEDEMKVHLNLLEDRFEYTVRFMNKLFENANYAEYAHLLGLLELPYKKPVLYTKHYKYD